MTLAKRCAKLCGFQAQRGTCAETRRAGQILVTSAKEVGVAGADRRQQEMLRRNEASSEPAGLFIRHFPAVSSQQTFAVGGLLYSQVVCPPLRCGLVSESDAAATSATSAGQGITPQTKR